MNKNTFILILLGIATLVAVGISLFLLFGQGKVPPGEAPQARQIPSYGGEFTDEGSLFVQSADSPIFPELSLYEELFAGAQEIVTFPVLYPRNLPAKFGLAQISAWRNEKHNTEGMNADYIGKQGGTFTLQETIIFDPDELGQTPQELLLDNENTASLWEFKDMNGIVQNRILLFHTEEQEESMIFYFLSSVSLSPQELIDIANSSL